MLWENPDRSGNSYLKGTEGGYGANHVLTTCPRSGAVTRTTRCNGIINAYRNAA